MELCLNILFMNYRGERERERQIAIEMHSTHMDDVCGGIQFTRVQCSFDVMIIVMVFLVIFPSEWRMKIVHQIFAMERHLL